MDEHQGGQIVGVSGSKASMLVTNADAAFHRRLTVANEAERAPNL
jgi:hypothetical protein